MICDHGDYTNFKWALDVEAEEDVKYLRPEYVAHWKAEGKGKDNMPKVYGREACHLRAMPVNCPVTQDKPKVCVTGKLSNEAMEAVAQVLTHLGLELTSFVE